MNKREKAALHALVARFKKLHGHRPKSRQELDRWLTTYRDIDEAKDLLREALVREARERAEKLLIRAETVGDSEIKRVMQQIALRYVKLAEGLEQVRRTAGR